MSREKGFIDFLSNQSFSAYTRFLSKAMSSSLAEVFPWPSAYVSQQHRFWQDCKDAQARLNLYCLHMLQQLFYHDMAHIDIFIEFFSHSLTATKNRHWSQSRINDR